MYNDVHIDWFTWFGTHENRWWWLTITDACWILLARLACSAGFFLDLSVRWLSQSPLRCRMVLTSVRRMEHLWLRWFHRLVVHWSIAATCCSSLAELVFIEVFQDVPSDWCFSLSSQWCQVMWSDINAFLAVSPSRRTSGRSRWSCTTSAVATSRFCCQGRNGHCFTDDFVSMSSSLTLSNGQSVCVYVVVLLLQVRMCGRNSEWYMHIDSENNQHMSDPWCRPKANTMCWKPPAPHFSLVSRTLLADVDETETLEHVLKWRRRCCSLSSLFVAFCLVLPTRLW